MPLAADPDSAEAAARVGRAWRELRRGPSTAALMEHLLGGHGDPDSLEPGQLDVLDLLTVRDDRRMSDLAAVLHVDPSTVTRTMQRMEASGLARRSGAHDDGRVVAVHLTAEGRRRHADVAARRTAMLSGILEVFDPAERDQLVTLLDRFVEALTAYASRLSGDRERAPG